MTALGIALPTAVFCSVMALNKGITETLSGTGDPDTILFIRKSSQSETNSTIPRDEAPIIDTLEGIEKDPSTGQPLVSRELIVLLNMPRLGGGGSSNVAIRGMSAAGRAMRPDVRLIEGSWPGEGLSQVAVAKSLVNRFENCKIGDRLPLGKPDWRVVGIFDAGSSSYGSEMWGDAGTLAADFGRKTGWGSVWVRAKKQPQKTASELLDSGAIPSSIATTVQSADSTKPPTREDILATLNLAEKSLVSPAGLSLLLAPKLDSQLKTMESMTESDYFRKQMTLGTPLQGITPFIAFFMAIGAAFAIMNTMYATVASRGREIAVLRAIGFKRRAILLSFIFESVILALIGAAIGAAVSFVVNGYSTGTTNFATFSELTFAFRVNGEVVLAGFIFGGVLGILGGLLPAIQASRQTITTAMRAI